MSSSDPIPPGGLENYLTSETMMHVLDAMGVQVSYLHGEECPWVMRLGRAVGQGKCPVEAADFLGRSILAASGESQDDNKPENVAMEILSELQVRPTRFHAKGDRPGSWSVEISDIARGDGPTLTDASRRLRLALQVLQYRSPEAMQGIAKAVGVKPPRPVKARVKRSECKTCDGTGQWAHPHNGDWHACDDCEEG